MGDESDCSDLTKKRSSNKHYRYHSSYSDFESAHTKIVAGFDDGILWQTYKQIPSATGSTHWYRCSYSHLCPRIQMKHNSIEETEHDFSFLFNSIKESIKKSSQLTYKPTKLIADNAAAIHNGFIACKYIILINKIKIIKVNASFFIVD